MWVVHLILQFTYLLKSSTFFFTDSYALSLSIYIYIYIYISCSLVWYHKFAVPISLCVCLSVCLSLSLSLPHTHTHTFTYIHALFSFLFNFPIFPCIHHFPPMSSSCFSSLLFFSFALYASATRQFFLVFYSFSFFSVNIFRFSVNLW